MTDYPSPKRLWFMSGTTAERTALTLVAGQPFWDTTLLTLWVGDGSTAGGIEVGGGATSTYGTVVETVTSSYSYPSGTTEETAYEYTASDTVARRFTGQLSLQNFTAGRQITFRVYVKADSTNYEMVDKREYVVNSYPDSVNIDYVTFRTTKITMQIDTTEGASTSLIRAIKVVEEET
jgi:hypothetical protein